MRVDTHIWFLANQEWDHPEAIESTLDFADKIMMKAFGHLNDFHKPLSLWYPDPVLFALTRSGSHLDAFLWSQKKGYRFTIVPKFDPYTVRAQDVVVLGPGTDEVMVGIYDTARSRGCNYVDARSAPYISERLN